MDMLIAGKFYAALERAGIPIASVSIGIETDRATWRVDYKPEATAAHRTTGEILRQTYDPATDTVWKNEQAMSRYDAEKLLQAVAVALWECIPNPLMTKAQLKARAIALYKDLL